MSETSRALAQILVIYLSSRALLFLVAVLSMRFLSDPVPERWDHLLLRLFCRWDCAWYLDIAGNGYSLASPGPEQEGMVSIAFYPVFPLLGSLLSSLTWLSVHDALFIVANACFLAALVYIHRYALLLGLSRSAAMTAVALICFVPQGFVFSVAYSESTFLLLLVAAMYHLRKGQMLRSGVIAAVLSATRPPGVFFIVFAIAHLLRTQGIAVLLRPWRNPWLFVPIVLAPLGLFCFWTLSWWLTGDAFAQASTVRHGWNWQPGWPHTNLLMHMRTGGEALFWSVSSLAVFALSLLLLVRRWYEEFLMCLAMFLLVWTAQIPASLFRYSIVLFPVWIGVAAMIDRRPTVSTIVFAGFGLLGGALMAAWTLGKWWVI